MIEQYINQIITMDILADSITIIDDKGIIRYIKVFHKTAIPINPTDMIGRHFLEVFPYININQSTVLRALHGESSFYHPFSQNGADNIMESVYPIKLEHKIIGAVCISYNCKKTLDAIHIKRPESQRHAFSIKEIIGDSNKMCRLKMQISQLAKTDANILIYGETGTGKEIVASAIHNLSSRRNKVFYSQNCAAIPEGLAEGLFFGTKKGIYTGSVDSPGILEQVNGGTMFFDEINSLNYMTQGKLLRAIETKKTQRLGSATAVSLDFRIISATNEDPFKCVEQGKLRNDLFYRLSTVILEIPPLRERLEDIPLLIDYFIQIHNETSMRQLSGVSDDVLEVFNNYSWPGNVRELQNVIASSIVFAKSSVIQKSDLPGYLLKKTKHETNTSIPYLAFSDITSKIKNADDDADIFETLAKEGISYQAAMEILERNYLDACQKRCSNQTRLAKDLKISRKSLSVKLKKHNLRPCDITESQ